MPHLTCGGKEKSEMEHKGQERRHFPQVRFPCIIKINASGRELRTHSENIGRGGIVIFLDEELSIGTALGIEIRTAKDKTIVGEGKVMWSREAENPIGGKAKSYNTGIMFTYLNGPSKEHLKELVNRLLEGKRRLEEKDK